MWKGTHEKGTSQKFYSPPLCLGCPSFSFCCRLSLNTRKLTRIAISRIRKNPTTRVMPILRGSGAEIAPAPTGPAQPSITFPWWNTEGNIEPDPFSGWFSPFTVKFARHPEYAGKMEWDVTKLNILFVLSPELKVHNNIGEKYWKTRGKMTQFRNQPNLIMNIFLIVYVWTNFLMLRLWWNQGSLIIFIY